MADLDQIMSERPQEIEQNQPEQRQEVPQQVEQQGQPRDDQGRFAGQQQPLSPQIWDDQFSTEFYQTNPFSMYAGTSENNPSS
jgi:hypothetical protein